MCFIGSLGGAAILIIAAQTKSASLLWFATAVLGTFCGPMWPAMQAIPIERYGLVVTATHYSFVLTAAKVGIAIEQMLFSKLLASRNTAWLAVWSVLGLITTVAGWFTVLHEWCGQ